MPSALVLPREWTRAKIRVGPGGKVQVGFAAKEAARIARAGNPGRGNPKCRTCGGTKRVPCPACARTGYVSRACIHCGGQGGADCPDCLKRKPKTGRNPGKPTLAQWLRQPGADAHEAIRNVPGLVGIHDVRAIEPIRWELWNLADYRVESAQAGVIWLARRREANRRSRGRNPHAAHTPAGSPAFQAGYRWYHARLRAMKGGGAIRLDHGADAYLKKIGYEGTLSLPADMLYKPSVRARYDAAKAAREDFIDGGDEAHNECLRRQRDGD